MHGGASFAAAGEDAGDAVLLEITDASFIAGEADPSPPPPVSVDDLAGLDPLPYPTIWVRADRTRQALAAPSSPDSPANELLANRELLLLPRPPRRQLQGGLFLAAENLLTECERWFRTMSSQSSSLLAPLDFLIDTWYFAQEHGINYVQDICPGYLAQNFVQVISRRSFVKLPYDLLYSTIECPFLTVDRFKSIFLFKPVLQVRICLLPLEFAAGTKRNWAEFGSKVESRILNLLKDSLRTVLDAIADDNLESYRVRITEYSKIMHFVALLTDEDFVLQKIVLSGCPQITTEILYISVLPPTNVGASLNKSYGFGYKKSCNHSIQTLCNSNPLDSMDECRHVMAFRMQELHLDGCKGIGYAAMSQLMSNVNITNFLCLRETTLTDGALCNFVGSSLEFLDISETVVSMVSLAPVIRRNSNLRCLKAAGCRNLLFEHGEVEAMSGGNIYGDFLQEITSTCCLEDVEMGWAFCPIRVTTLIPSFSKVRKMTIGLGTTLPENILCALPDICPFLESLVLRFQMISDKVVRNLLKSSTKLRVLCLYSCLGNLTSFSFQIKAPLLRILRLEWITPWMTNDDLAVLIQNYNLVELSLSGCKLLDSNSQELISSGWPNLTCLHLEFLFKPKFQGFSAVISVATLLNK
ncbi:F-box protein-like [Oryza sativa Japonica Group]|uniref:F-box protein-like n=1 Tax=Oryza sativa subsp. japonica TaxID=39947 RepID=Q8S9Z7_ORYSJ|nr:F-box protein-like [Oryza sativa Japonica Group]BAF07433.1 Os01g0968600 [Oryza sativa Japonica Group]|eukprot:NP_001045519.1 Os01g0968600 [Oryza sativa Japonica Group]